MSSDYSYGDQEEDADIYFCEENYDIEEFDDLNLFDDSPHDSDDKADQDDSDDSRSHYQDLDLHVWKTLSKIKTHKPNVIWEAITSGRYLWFKTPNDLNPTAKATLIIQGLHHLMSKHSLYASKCAIFWTLGLLEWSILPFIAGSKLAVQALKKLTRNTYILALQGFCPFLFEIRPFRKYQVHSIEQFDFSSNQTLSGEGALIKQNPNDVHGCIASVNIDTSKDQVLSKEKAMESPRTISQHNEETPSQPLPPQTLPSHPQPTRVLQKSSVLRVPFIGSFNYENKNYFIPEKKRYFCSSSAEEELKSDVDDCAS